MDSEKVLTDAAADPASHVEPVGTAGASPLPVLKKIRPEPSDMSPVPACQIPAPPTATEVSVVHIDVWVPELASTPTMKPR